MAERLQHWAVGYQFVASGFARDEVLELIANPLCHWELVFPDGNLESSAETRSGASSLGRLVSCREYR
jgi:hypothetical protein